MAVQRRDIRGFASMERDKQRRIASEGGRASHEKGTAHEFSADEAREAGRKGGLAVSRNREHMAAIGRKGGATPRNRQSHETTLNDSLAITGGMLLGEA
ncbi:MAG TPA: KGG domain-containing protein [Herpetosiphonaceae bacterium]|nr:KGG domain-containing protein [Herpetosiphonaceae bacterium]